MKKPSLHIDPPDPSAPSLVWEDWLYVGPILSVTDETLSSLGITHLINASNLPCPVATLPVVDIRVPDQPTAEISALFPLAHEFVRAARAGAGAGGAGAPGGGRPAGRVRVLVFCQAGVSRSATLAISIVMVFGRVSVDRAMRAVRAGRPVIDPNPGFRAQLAEFAGDVECDLVLEDPVARAARQALAMDARRIVRRAVLLLSHEFDVRANVDPATAGSYMTHLTRLPPRKDAAFLRAVDASREAVRALSEDELTALVMEGLDTYALVPIAQLTMSVVAEIDPKMATSMAAHLESLKQDHVDLVVDSTEARLAEIES
jgi:hypothetical protein